eukprot:CAMPEP_0197415560 /NCGR_PEP_ID=MMETSP1170-20131217/2068_1 /TAXON_ID=54406 /ORGANISM="Sarcinochrysis sp, Strain CCMP770" /LENGTH=138 /DNA_ID=CAMNT_0042942375 /DNA_START=65 /DNA_END=480 /DNA_ORIENTATION=-
MPWQTAPGLIIIVGCFTVSGALIPVVHQFFKGKPRVTGRDNWDFLMEKRDDRLKAEGKFLGKPYLTAVAVARRTHTPGPSHRGRRRRPARRKDHDVARRSRTTTWDPEEDASSGSSAGCHELTVDDGPAAPSGRGASW